MVGQEKRPELSQVVRLRHKQAEFLHQPFEILFRTLLTVEAHAIMKRSPAAMGFSCEDA